MLACRRYNIGVWMFMAEPLPHVHIITTGGTIAATPSGMLMPADLLATIPDVGELAEITVEPFLDVGSSWITPAHWLQLATRIETLWQTRPELSGIVITHGTDTLEETAYFLHLTGRDPRPIVLTGAMRSAQALSADGPANLRAAIAVAATPAARSRGVLVVLDNQIHAARHVSKAHTLRVDAFTSGAGGVLGTIYEDDLVWFQAQLSNVPKPFSVSADTTLARVDILYSYVGADGQLIAAAVIAGTRGIVLASFGSGRLTEGQIAAVQATLEEGTIVVLSSRVGHGAVEGNYRHNLAMSAEAQGCVLGGDLSPQKARVLLILALTHTSNPRTIQELFDQY